TGEKRGCCRLTAGSTPVRLLHVVFGEAHKTHPVLVACGVSELAADVVFRVLSAVGKGDGEFLVPRHDRLGFLTFGSVAVSVLFLLAGGCVDDGGGRG